MSQHLAKQFCAVYVRPDVVQVTLTAVLSGLSYYFFLNIYWLFCAVFPVSLRESWVVWVWWESLAFLSEWVQSQSFIKYFSLCTLVKLFGRMLMLHVGCLTVRGWLGWLQCWGLCLLKCWIQRFCYCVFAVFIILFSYNVFVWTIFVSLCEPFSCGITLSWDSFAQTSNGSEEISNLSPPAADRLVSTCPTFFCQGEYVYIFYHYNCLATDALFAWATYKSQPQSIATHGWLIVHLRLESSSLHAFQELTPHTYFSNFFHMCFGLMPLQSETFAPYIHVRHVS